MLLGDIMQSRGDDEREKRLDFLMSSWDWSFNKSLPPSLPPRLWILTRRKILFFINILHIIFCLYLILPSTLYNLILCRGCRNDWSFFSANHKPENKEDKDFYHLILFAFYGLILWWTSPSRQKKHFRTINYALLWVILSEQIPSQWQCQQPDKLNIL